MLEAGQHRRATPLTAAVATLVLAVACSSPTTDTATDPRSDGLAAPSLSAQLPAQRLDGMHATETVLDDAAAASLEATHPDEVRDVLASGGFVGARERIYAGRVGAFARVVLRAWQFRDETGASAYLTWLERNAREWIGASRLIETGPLSPAVTVALHDVSGCCHGETPIYLASWQRGSVVWTIRASGPRIQTQPVLKLVADVEAKV